MPQIRTRVRRVAPRVASDGPRTSDHAHDQTGRLVLGVALVCVVAATAVRCWALYGSWFYLDDYVLLEEARGRGVSASYLLTPYAGHLFPGGRLLMSWLAATGPLNWGLAATVTVATQLLAGLAATWALTTLFGRRWSVLVPLNLYLWSATTVPAMMWLSGAIFLVPQQVSFWLAIGTWVLYLRGRALRWLALSVAAVSLGLAFDVKSVLTVPVLAFLAVAYFSHGSPWRRFRTVLARYWVSVAVMVVALIGYLSFYLSRSSAPLQRVTAGQLGDLANVMLGSTFASTAVGGPWRWTSTNVPTVYADAPGWAQHLAWVVIAAVVLGGWLLRTRTLRAWVLVACYLAVLLGLLGTSRGLTFGTAVGSEPRYFTDAAMVLALCVGLAFIPLLDSVEASLRRDEPRLLLDLRVPSVVLVVLVCLGSLISTVRYVHVWHTENASKQWIEALRDGVRAAGPVDLVDRPLPEGVMSSIVAPRNGVADLARLASDQVRFPAYSPELLVVADDGSLRQAAIELGVTSQPGPRPGCGWLVRDRGADVALAGRAFEWTWWLRIGYLASQDSPVTVVAGDSRTTTTVTAGLNNLYVRVDGSFDSVRLEGLDAGASMCVSTIEVGQPVPGGAI